MGFVRSLNAGAGGLWHFFYRVFRLSRMIYGSFLLFRSQSENKCYEALDTPSWKVLSATILLATFYMSRTVCRPLSLPFLIRSPGKVNFTDKLAQLMKEHQELKRQHSPCFAASQSHQI